MREETMREEITNESDHESEHEIMTTCVWRVRRKGREASPRAHS